MNSKSSSNRFLRPQIFTPFSTNLSSVARHLCGFPELPSVAAVVVFPGISDTKSGNHVRIVFLNQAPELEKAIPHRRLAPAFESRSGANVQGFEMYRSGAFEENTPAPSFTE